MQECKLGECERGHDLSLQPWSKLVKASSPAIFLSGRTIQRHISGPVPAAAQKIDEEILRCELLY
jgi:hypothetical protein